MFGKRSAIAAFGAMMLWLVGLVPSAHAAEVVPATPIVNQSTTCGVRDTLTLPANSGSVTYSVSGENVIATKASTDSWPSQLPQGWERTSNANRVEFRIGVLNTVPCPPPAGSPVTLGVIRVTEQPRCGKRAILIKPVSNMFVKYTTVWEDRQVGVAGSVHALVVHPSFRLPDVLPQGWDGSDNPKEATFRFFLPLGSCVAGGS